MSSGLKYYLTWPQTERQHAIAAAGFLAIAVVSFAVGPEVGGFAFFGVSLGMGLRMVLMDDPSGVEFG